MTQQIAITQKNTLPTWLLILTGVLVVFNFFVFGWMTLLAPLVTWPDAGSGGVFPIQFFAVRHIAFALPLFRGLIKRDVKLLTTMYHIFLVIALLDVALIFVNGYYIPLVVQLLGVTSRLTGGLIAAVMFIIPMGFTVRYLHTNYDV